MSDKVQMKVYVSKEARDRVNNEADSANISNSEYVERLVWDDAHGRNRDAIDARIENKEAQLTAAVKTRDHEQTNVETLQSELEALREKRAEIEYHTDEYQSDIEAIEPRLDAGERIFKNHKIIRELNEKYGKGKADIHGDIMNEFDDYPDVAFELAKAYEPNDWRKEVDGYST